MIEFNLKSHGFRKGSFFIYIFEDKETYDCYIQKKDYGIIYYMFGLPREATSYSQVKEIIKANFERYELLYKELFIKED